MTISDGFKKLLLILALVITFAHIPCEASAPSRPEILNFYNTAETAMKEYGDYNRALSNFLKFIKTAESNPAEYTDMLMKTYSSVSIIYGSFLDYNKAVEYNLKGLALSRECGNLRYEVSFLTNLASCMIMLNKLDAADSYAVQLKSLSGDSIAQFNHYIIKGDIARKHNDWEKARTNWEGARDLSEQFSLAPARKAYPYECLATYYEYHHSPDSQLVYLKKAYDLAETGNEPFRKIQTLRELMRFHTRNGNSHLASHFQDKYFELTDSLMNMEDFLRINSNHEKFLLDEKIEQVDALIITVSGQRRIIIAVAAILLLLLAFVVVIWRQKCNLNRAYLKLYEHTHESLRQTPGESAPAISGDSMQTQSPAEISEADNTLFSKIEDVLSDSSQLCRQDFSLASLASIVGSNTSNVSRVINLKTGQNVRAFINSYRIKEACRRIDDKKNFGHMTLQAIGESVGYNTQVNFNRMFKAATGMTPSIYMKLSSRERTSTDDTTE